MRATISTKAGIAAIWLLTCATTIQAHTWIDEIRRIASNGTLVGPSGYMRGYAPRLPGWNTNDDDTYEIQVEAGAPMCKSSQNIGNYTAGYGMLEAAPQDFIALRYEENGHVTLTDAALPPNTPSQPVRPAGNGTVYVYGTKQPSDNDTYLGIHRVWNAAGTGGDKRGKLLATRYFDDGQCYQYRVGSPDSLARMTEVQGPESEVPCQTDVQLPADAGTSGTYTLYWVWEYPVMNNSTGAIETVEDFTACMDIKMISEPLPPAGDFDSSQSVTSRAVEAHMKTAFMVDPTATPVLQAQATLFSSSAPSGTAPASSAQGGSAAPTTSQSGVTSTGVSSAVTVPTSSSVPGVAFVTVTVTTTVNPSTQPAIASSTLAQSYVPLSSSSSTPQNSTITTSAQQKSNAAPTGRPAVTPFLSARAAGESSKVAIRGRWVNLD
ncbi:hypothetical protein G7Y89_g14251 [Cudoniella acicularis]|uniref:DUF7492 domain-containing protein n=1 Tax=Cudoniella acicularis TaxID=354080 RepID=A0A8H4R3J4_9HELO|nr:hypothetical protein G7Y89_g14251 [Cudoniella acicularis]